MIADIFILVLILGYCAFLIYRGYKIKKKGNLSAAQAAAVTAAHAAAVVHAAGMGQFPPVCRISDERWMRYGKFNRFHVLCIWSFSSYIYCRSGDLSDISADKKEKRP